MDIKKMTFAELLALHAQIEEELRARDILRSANKPTGDFAEYVFCSAFGWEREPNSKKGYDATDNIGTRYQIKGCRMHRGRKDRQLSVLRDLKSRPFDILAGVLFADDYQVLRAALIPWAVVDERATYSTRQKGHIFHLRDEVWLLDGVRDVADMVRL